MPDGQLKEKVVDRPHPGGGKGAIISLDECAKRMWASRKDPRIRAWTTQQLAKCGVSTGTVRAKVQCIVDAYRKKVPYVSDPKMVEFMANPVNTLCLDEHGLCIVGGDCDDATITCGACCLSIGLDVQVVGASYKDTKTPTHVYFAVKDESGDWLRADATTTSSVGTVIGFAREWWVDPIEGIKADANGFVQGDFVGVGKADVIPMRAMQASARSPTWMRQPAGLSHGGRRVAGFGLGDWSWPHEALDYQQMWTPYVEGTVAALKACAAATTDPTASHQMTVNAGYAESIWHAFDNYSYQDFIGNTSAILWNWQVAVYLCGDYAKQAIATGGCPNITWPPPAPLPQQSLVIDALQDVGYIAAGQLDLLTWTAQGAADGIVVAVKKVVQAAGGLLKVFESPWPWVALTGVAGAVIVYYAWPRGR